MNVQKLLLKRFYTNEILYKHSILSSWNRSFSVSFSSSVFSVEICLDI
jgi:hypothetical protein